MLQIAFAHFRLCLSTPIHYKQLKQILNKINSFITKLTYSHNCIPKYNKNSPINTLQKLFPYVRSTRRSKGKNQLFPSLCNQIFGRPVMKSYGI